MFQPRVIEWDFFEVPIKLLTMSQEKSKDNLKGFIWPFSC